MPAAAYFKLLAALMIKNPPSEVDSPIIGKMAKVGIVSGKDFDILRLDPGVAKALEQAATGLGADPGGDRAYREESEWLADDIYRKIRHRLPIPCGDSVGRPRTARKELRGELAARAGG